jgi:hypothetical protein
MLGIIFGRCCSKAADKESTYSCATIYKEWEVFKLLLNGIEKIILIFN